MNATAGSGVRSHRPQPDRALLVESIVEDVQSGRYPVGSLLPTVAALCAQFSVSRRDRAERVVDATLSLDHAESLDAGLAATATR